MSVKLPFIQWRDGRPRFAVSRREIDLGFQTCVLRHHNGAWFTYEECRTWIYGADGKSGVHGDIVAARVKGRPIRQAPAALDRGRTVERLIEDWWRDISAERGDDRLADNSLRSYRKDADALIYQPETRTAARERRNAQALGARQERARELFAQKPVAAIGVPELNAHYKYLKAARGHHMALHAINAFSAAWNWGQKSTVWRLGLNPRHQLELSRPEGRIRLVPAHGIAALVAAADAMGRTSIGHAVLLGLFNGQRQNDRLAMADSGMIDGRRRFRQSKTRMVVEIKETPRLAARMAEARAQALRTKLTLQMKEPPATIVFDESNGQPYTSTTYRHRFEDARQLAIGGWLASETLEDAMRRTAREFAGHRVREAPLSPGTNDDWRLEPCRDLAFNDDGAWDPARDQDLRDTCVTLLYRAGCSLQEICDITGHSYQAVKTIRDHYLARDPASADAAIDKLVIYMQQTGMAV